MASRSHGPLKLVVGRKQYLRAGLATTRQHAELTCALHLADQLFLSHLQRVEVGLDLGQPALALLVRHAAISQAGRERLPESVRSEKRHDVEGAGWRLE